MKVVTVVKAHDKIDFFLWADLDSLSSPQMKAVTVARGKNDFADIIHYEPLQNHL